MAPNPTIFQRLKSCSQVIGFLYIHHSVRHLADQALASQVSSIDTILVHQGMILRRREHIIGLRQPLDVYSIHPRNVEGYSQIATALFQCDQGRGICRCIYFDNGIRVRFLKALEGNRQDCRRNCRKARNSQTLTETQTDLLSYPVQRFNLRNTTFDFLEKTKPFGCRLEPTARAHEQLETHAALQLGYHTTDSGLCEAHRFCGRDDCPQTHHMDESL